MHIRKPRLRITSKGVKVTKPTLRVGGKHAGVNISKSGLSGSVRTKAGTANTKRGCSIPILGRLFLLISVMAVVLLFRTNI